MRNAHNIHRCVLTLICFLMSIMAWGQNITVTGMVTDSVSDEPLAYASLKIKGTGTGVTTDLDGSYTISLPKNGAQVEVSYIGYDTRTITLRPSDDLKTIDISLVPSGITLAEVTIKPRRQKYRKKGNPAVEFVRRVIDHRQMGDPRQHDFYSYQQYEQIIFAKNDFTPRSKNSGKKSRFSFVREYIDTLENGTTVLPVSEKEKVQTVFYRKQPKSEKRLISGYRSNGIDEIFSSDGVKQFLGEVFREVDIFKNDVPLFLQRFVSPLSTIGPNYYKYYLLDTLDVEGHKCVDLGFVPFNSETFGFSGHLYVTLDSTYFVKKSVLNVPKDINLNFVSNLTIEQDYERLSDGTRITTRDDIRVNFKLTERSKGLYARRLCIYSGHTFNEPTADERQIFFKSAPEISLDDYRYQPDDFWNKYRPAEIASRGGRKTESFMAHLKSIPAFNITMKVLSTLVSGYIPTHPDPQKSKFEFGPMNSTVNYNPLEGYRFRVGGTTTTAFSRRLFMDGYVAYGERDGKMKYDGLIEYSFNPRKEFRKEFPVHSLRFEYMYDINKLGQDYMYTSKDNMMLMIRRKKDQFITYLRQAELTYYREQYNGLAYGAILRHRREETSSLTQFQRIYADGSIRPLDHYKQTELELKLRYAKNEKFYQTRNLRIPITFDALVFNLSHRMAARHFLGSDYNYQRTDIGLQKRIWLSAFGYLDVIIKAGKVWTKVPYPLLVLPNANLTYTIQPESYTNMNQLEFINDEYASWDITYYMNGNLLNRLPLIKKLKWREVFCFRGLWGNLTEKNNPSHHDDGLFVFPASSHIMGSTPYMEASVGIENILKFLRIDYVWRLSYLDHANIQKHGVRMTMAFTF